MQQFYKKSNSGIIIPLFLIILATFCICFQAIMAQGIPGTTSANGVEIIYQDGFNANSLHTGAAPFPTDKWVTRRFVSPNWTTIHNANSIAPSTDSWGGASIPGYETGTTHSIQFRVFSVSSSGTIGTNDHILWTPVLPELPTGKKSCFVLYLEQGQRVVDSNLPTELLSMQIQI